VFCSDRKRLLSDPLTSKTALTDDIQDAQLGRLNKKRQLFILEDYYSKVPRN